MKNLSAIMMVVLLVFLMMGCSSVRMTMTPRSMLEEKLLVHGLERALSGIDIESIKGKRVTIETVGLTKDDLPFAESYLRFWLLKNDVRIVQNPTESDINLKVLLTVLAVDQSETLPESNGIIPISKEPLPGLSGWRLASARASWFPMFSPGFSF